MTSLIALTGCPNPYRVPGGGRFSPGYAILCGCPGEGVYRPRHWVYCGVPFFCACAPHEDPALGPGGWYTGNDSGYACRSCAIRLPDYAILRHLVQDMACCWCGGPAGDGSGYRICGHPARKDKT